MNWQKQLEQQEAAFVRGVRTAVLYGLPGACSFTSRKVFNNCVKEVLKSAGWSEQPAAWWSEHCPD